MKIITQSDINEMTSARKIQNYIDARERTIARLERVVDNNWGKLEEAARLETLRNVVEALRLRLGEVA